MDSSFLRQAFGQFATGITVITTSADAEMGNVHGMTANSFTSVSLDPPIVLVCINRRTVLHRLLCESRRFGVSILSDWQSDMADHFAGRGNQPGPIAFEPLGDTAVLPGAIAQFDCHVIDLHAAADHVVALAKVCQARNNGGSPLIYHSSRYERLANAMSSSLTTQ